MAKYASEPMHVGDIPLSETATLRVSLVEDSNGRRQVDIRRWMSAEFYSGPTKKGVRLGVDKLEELQTLLVEAAASAS